MISSDEWRVEVHLEDDEHHFALGEQIRALDLDEDARRRLGGSVTVTRDASHMFLYASSEGAAREAEGVVRELVSKEDLAASIQLTRWHPEEEAWRDAAEPLPQTEEEREAERRRHEEAEAAEAVEEGEYDYEVHVDPPSHGEAVKLERELKDAGLPVRRLWKHLSIGALTEERAHELVDQVRSMAPQRTEVSIGATEIQHPLFVFFGSALDRFR